MGLLIQTSFGRDRGFADDGTNRSGCARYAVSISACALTEAVPAVHLAPAGARLVVDGRLQKVWVDGVEVEGLAPGSHPFRFIEMLAKKSPAPVSSDDIVAHLSPRRQDENTTARVAKNAARKLIREAMKKAGRSFDEDVFPPAGTGCYRCTVPSYVSEQP